MLKGNRHNNDHLIDYQNRLNNIYLKTYSKMHSQFIQFYSAPLQFTCKILTAAITYLSERTYILLLSETSSSRNLLATYLPINRYFPDIINGVRWDTMHFTIDHFSQNIPVFFSLTSYTNSRI